MLPILFYVVRTVRVGSSSSWVPRATHKYPVDREPHDAQSLGLDHPLHPNHASASTSFSFLRPPPRPHEAAAWLWVLGGLEGGREEGRGGGKQKQPKQQLLLVDSGNKLEQRPPLAQNGTRLKYGRQQELLQDGGGGQGQGDVSVVCTYKGTRRRVCVAVKRCSI